MMPKETRRETEEFSMTHVIKRWPDSILRAERQKEIDWREIQLFEGNHGDCEATISSRRKKECNLLHYT
jgi:hypothetical protein